MRARVEQFYSKVRNAAPVCARFARRVCERVEGFGMVRVSRRRTVTGRQWIPFSGARPSRAGHRWWVWSSRGLLMTVPWAQGYLRSAAAWRSFRTRTTRSGACPGARSSMWTWISCLPLTEIAPQIACIVREEILADEEGAYDVPDETEMKNEMTRLDLRTPENLPKLGHPSGFTCPECDRPLWEMEDKKVLRHRSRSGTPTPPRTCSPRRPRRSRPRCG